MDPHRDHAQTEVRGGFSRLPRGAFSCPLFNKLRNLEDIEQSGILSLVKERIGFGRADIIGFPRTIEGHMRRRTRRQGVCFFGNDTPNPSFAVLYVARFGQAFSPPETRFKGARAVGISANLEE
jgi:hypothetical protein